MVRLLLPLLVFAACGPGYEDDIAYFPDAGTAGCPYVGYFEIASPVADLHYSPHVDVHIRSAELYGDPDTALQFSMIDDTGASYPWASVAREALPPDPSGSQLWLGSVFHYELPTAHRFTLTVSYCDASQVQTVEFFTSAE